MAKLTTNALVWAFVAAMLSFIYLPVVVLVLVLLPKRRPAGTSFRWAEPQMVPARVRQRSPYRLLVEFPASSGGLSAAAATLLGFLSRLQPVPP